MKNCSLLEGIQKYTKINVVKEAEESKGSLDNSSGNFLNIDTYFPTGTKIAPDFQCSKSDQISEHFTLSDLTKTSRKNKYGKIYSNMPDTKKHLDNLYTLAYTLLEPIYQMTGGKIQINSAYRCKVVNDAVGSTDGSQHRKGEAVDLDAIKGLTNKELFKMLYSAIKTGKLSVGQLLWEGGSYDNPAWIHVSLPTRGYRNNQVLALAPKRNINTILKRHKLA